jgi:hypothetical protein
MCFTGEEHTAGGPAMYIENNMDEIESFDF